MRFFVTLVGLSFLAAGCGNPGPPVVAVPLRPALPDFEPLPIPNDESLTTDEAIRLGMTSPDRDWNAQDMANAQQVIVNLAQTDPQQLPRYRSARSGRIFARMTTPLNLDAFRNPALPVEARLGQLLPFVQSGAVILMAYHPLFLKKWVSDSEMIEQLGSQLRGNALMVELLNELKPTIQPDDPNYTIRMAGFEQTRLGLASVVSGNLTTLTERKHIRDSELLRLAGYMQETFPTIVPNLRPADRDAMLQRMTKMESDPAMAGLQQAVAEVRKRVETALKPQP